MDLHQVRRWRRAGNVHRRSHVAERMKTGVDTDSGDTGHGAHLLRQLPEELDAVRRRRDSATRASGTRMVRI